MRLTALSMPNTDPVIRTAFEWNRRSKYWKAISTHTLDTWSLIIKQVPVCGIFKQTLMCWNYLHTCFATQLTTANNKRLYIHLCNTSGWWRRSKCHNSAHWQARPPLLALLNLSNEIKANLQTYISTSLSLKHTTPPTTPKMMIVFCFDDVWKLWLI